MNILKLYRDSIKGLKKEVWFLALITLVNRAGTMVIPFLSLYLTANLIILVGSRLIGVSTTLLVFAFLAPKMGKWADRSLVG